MQKLKNAIDLALSGQWDQAHKIVQNAENRTAYWIHAVLHKIEGDLGNSKYWYSRAQEMEHFSMDPDEELRLIRQGLPDA
jgi:hypothetical protein